jgi:uncharacterized membrane protein
VVVTVAAAPYLVVPMEQLAAMRSGLAAHYVGQPAWVQAGLYVHLVAGSIALLTGPWQLVRRLRTSRPGVHRALGLAYLGGIVVSGTASLLISPFGTTGIAGFIGFGTLSVLWLATAVQGWRAIRACKIAEHQAWMIRSMALTFAAVTLRAWLGLLITVQMPFVAGPIMQAAFEHVFANAYAPMPFLAWLPNLVIAEIMVRRRGLPRV